MLDGEGRIDTGPVSLNQEAKIKASYGKTVLGFRSGRGVQLASRF